MAKDSKQMTGYLYVLAAAVLWSLIGPFSKLCMEEGLAPLEVAFWRALLGGALALFPFVDFAPTRSWTAWANLLALGVVTNYGAYLAYGRSLQIINQVKAAIIGNIEPVLATFWVWLFWNENFSAYGWAGSALVIPAVFLLTADRS